MDGSCFLRPRGRQLERKTSTCSNYKRHQSSCGQYRSTLPPPVKADTKSNCTFQIRNFPSKSVGTPFSEKRPLTDYDNAPGHHDEGGIILARTMALPVNPVHWRDKCGNRASGHAFPLPPERRKDSLCMDVSGRLNVYNVMMMNEHAS